MIIVLYYFIYGHPTTIGTSCNVNKDLLIDATRAKVAEICHAGWKMESELLEECKLGNVNSYNYSIKYTCKRGHAKVD